MKPNEAMLNEFYNEAKTLDIFIIGSLLISQLCNSDAGFHIKAKTLYTIEHLCKKSVQYSVYFKFNVDRIRNSAEPTDNAETYGRIKKNVLMALGGIPTPSS